MKTSWIIGTLTFGGAATAAVLLAASYPVAIWAVGFAALYKSTHPAKPSHVDCPLLQAAAAREEGVSHVVARDYRGQ